LKDECARDNEQDTDALSGHDGDGLDTKLRSGLRSRRHLGRCFLPAVQVSSLIDGVWLLRVCRSFFHGATSRSAEREDEDLNLRIVERDLEQVVGDGAALPHELVEALVHGISEPVLVHVYAVRRSRRLSVDEHSESDGCARSRRAHHQVQIAGVGI
jgi:hypothetical protein